MSAIARILDANANRAREALRVMEDAARFALNDAELSEALKALRHDLRAALDRLPAGWPEANRDVRGDVGTVIEARGEYERRGLADVVRAAGKRLTEALRVLEETGKTVNAEFARRIESLRYRAYDLESSLQRRLGSSRTRQWRVCVLLTESLCRRPWREALRDVIEAGADCIQVREKDMDSRGLVERVREVIDRARPAGASVIVNDRADIALAAGADGVHLGRDDLSVADVRCMAGRTLIMGASTHNLEEAEAAVRAGADYCGVGAMFETPLKPDAKPAGPDYLRAFIEHHPGVTHLAIGGITAGNIHQLAEVGCRGVAVSSAVCGSAKPGDVVKRLREALGRT